MLRPRPEKQSAMTPLFWVIAVLIQHAANAETESAHFLIKRMVAASSALNYQGVFVYQRGAQLDSMRILHQLDGDTEIERLVSLSGPAREVIRKGNQVQCYFADDREVMVEKTVPKDFFTFGLNRSLDEISGHYQLRITGATRVAGRPAVTVSIVPNESDRYAYQLVVDEQHGLLLKSAVYGREGSILEQVQFADISIGKEIPLAAFEPQLSGEEYTWYTSDKSAPDDDSRNPAAPRWVAEWLPSGFTMRNEVWQRFADEQSPVSHLVYTDGIAMVSIFIEENSPRNAPDQNQSTLGAVNALSLKHDRHLVTVVGELPPPTLQRIAASVAKID